jgi:hypothetical protein
VIFVEIAQSVYVHTSIGTIKTDGHSWLGCGDLGAVGDIQNSGEIQAANVSLTLSGIPTENIDEILNANLQGEGVNIYIGSLNENMKFEGKIHLLWTGYVDTTPFSYGKNISISIQCESEMVDWQRPRLRRYCDADQQEIFPGDEGFIFAPQMESISLEWGQK